MPKVKREQEVTVTHTDTNGRTIPDGGRGERLARGEAKWSTSGKRTDKGGKESE